MILHFKEEGSVLGEREAKAITILGLDKTN